MSPFCNMQCVFSFCRRVLRLEVHTVRLIFLWFYEKRFTPQQKDCAPVYGRAGTSLMRGKCVFLKHKSISPYATPCGKEFVCTRNYWF